MNADYLKKLKNSLIKHEGIYSHPIVDFDGQIKIGVGYNLTERGISDNWINNQLVEDILYFEKSFQDNFTWFEQLSSSRKIVLINLAFIGWKKFILEFEIMLDYLAKGDYDQAAIEIIDSDLSIGRALDLAEIMKNGND